MVSVRRRVGENLTASPRPFTGRREKPPEPMDRPTLIITAVAAELVPIQRKLRMRRTAPFARVMPSCASGERPLFGVVSGMGAPTADELIDAALEATGAEAIIIAGLAGALVSAAHTGEIIVPAETIDHATGQTLRPMLDLGVVPGGRLVTCETPVPTPTGKAELAERYGASAVDMETAHLAAACATRGVPWAAVRAIGDELRDTMPPPFAGLVKADGRADPLAALKLLVNRPDLLPALLRTARCAQLGGRSLAIFLRGVLLEGEQP